MDEMLYHITYEGRRIASFLHASDRDMCLDEFECRHSDCIFGTEDDE